MSTQPFAEFLETHHRATAEDLSAAFGDKAFLLVREPDLPPQIVTLTREAPGVIGSAPDATYSTKGLAATHCEVRFHPGFSSWVLVATEPTGVCGSLAPSDRPLVLGSRDELRFPTSKVRLQFYDAKALIERLRKVGATKRVKRASRVSAPAAEGRQQPQAPATPAPEPTSRERPSRRMSSAANGVSWGE
jgi:hypothetical protein